MPIELPNESSSPRRVTFVHSLTSAEVKALVADPRVETIQTATPVDTATWELLDFELFSKRPEIELRVYGYYSADWDLSFLPRLRNLRRLSVDSLIAAKGHEHLSSIQDIESLAVGIYGLENFDFLAGLPGDRLRKLSLMATKSRRPSLRHVARFHKLKTLYLEGQRKDIEVIAQLSGLEDLTLRSVSIDGLDFLKPLNYLRCLDIKLGGIRDLSALNGMEGIRYLQLWCVRGLCDLSVISSMCGLENLFLQALRNVYSLPDVSKLTALRSVHLEDMKGIKDISPLALAPALEELIHLQASGMHPSQYVELLKSKTLKRLLVLFGSLKKNKELLDLATMAGIDQAEVNLELHISGWRTRS